MLLVFAFPGFSVIFLAWIGLVPWFFALQSCTSRLRAAWCGYVTGLVFFGLSIHWLTFVHPVAWLLTVLLESVFFALFSLAAYEGCKLKNELLRFLWIPLAWTFFEWLRAEIPVFGFGWNLLAHSQASHLEILQVAGALGAYGLGFFMVFVNLCFFQILKDLKNISGGYSWSRVVFLIAFIAALFGSFVFYGRYQLANTPKSESSIRVSLVQGNIPQQIKWDRRARPRILEIYELLTRLVQYDQPDIAFWPEASFPGYFNIDQDATQVRELVKELQLPLIVGSPYYASFDEAYNSAFLVNGLGEIVDRYDKQYLVPFGEYVPLKFIFGWLEPVAYTMGVSDFYAGTESRIFKTPNEQIPFSVLICFEDIFPSLASNAVRQGAEFLAVITNDAWFGPTAAAHQHLQSSIFRAVENGVPIVRAANTGVSAFISSSGEVTGKVAQNEKDIFVAGKATQEVVLNRRPTLYLKGGWLFPYGVALLFLIFVLSWSRLVQKES